VESKLELLKNIKDCALDECIEYSLDAETGRRWSCSSATAQIPTLRMT